MRTVINSSPLIFLSKLGYLDALLTDAQTFYIPEAVVQEISAKPDQTASKIQAFLKNSQIQIREAHLLQLVSQLSLRFGKGEAEAIALALELSADTILLDDFAARQEALRLGLKVKGTLAIIFRLRQENRVPQTSLDDLYQELINIRFRVKRSIFDQIFFDS
ncbi:DUF3368 domain-containing protein [Romeria aff. gracilis LEGE 07310]|uniref:DUF3368 domain-containing protein n=1 Tax=Vasconcelosia minhoensis LEGE 07310 TaxID=915328 RepID=A0A8J7DR38_9CYAN|nr:DUF3368 domain-containing protein [Romeria gracilis]MBE9077704.1 DUF3368 domain-containing protein [Romeria aff. gracilis LEGE 07310]